MGWRYIAVVTLAWLCAGVALFCLWATLTGLYGWRALFDTATWGLLSVANVLNAKNMRMTHQTRALLDGLRRWDSPRPSPTTKGADKEMDDIRLDEFRAFLIAKATDPTSVLSIDERALFSLLSVPMSAQKLCTKDELEAIVQAVTKAMRAAVTASHVPQPNPDGASD